MKILIIYNCLKQIQFLKNNETYAVLNNHDVMSKSINKN